MGSVVGSWRFLRERGYASSAADVKLRPFVRWKHVRKLGNIECDWYSNILRDNNFVNTNSTKRIIKIKRTRRIIKISLFLFNF